jgi:hypothetical protein
MSHECEYCCALHFIQEQTASDKLFEMCCKRGDAVLDLIRAPPAELRALLEGQDPRGRAFRQNIRAYNGALTFTSMSYTQDRRLDLSGGLHCFQAHGEVFHYQGPLLPGSQELPSFAQLFFYDPEYATNTRATRYPHLDRTVLAELAQMLADCNPFIGIYRTARERLADAPSRPFRLLLNPQMRLVMEAGADRRRENLPTSDEVAVILPDEFTAESRRDIVLAVRDPAQNQPRLTVIDVSHAAYMPLHYVLLFPQGDYGWHYELQLREGQRTRQRLRLEQRPYYRFRLHVRSNEYPALFLSQRLFQQYVVDAFAACETTALQWLRSNQKNIRADVYNGLADTLIRQDIDASEIGRRIILPASFTGSDRYMQQLFQDSMAIVRYFGKPTFFITFTANPRWPEIVRNLFPGQQAVDRPDLIARVFALKLKEFIADLKGGLFGPYVAHVGTVEYQKRGLPHYHVLLFIDSSAPFLTPERIDEVICAELPDPAWDPTGELTDVVIAQMTHGPCGQDYPNSPCMSRRTPSSPLACQKRFPKPFTDVTVVNEDSYPQYRRRDDGRTFTVRKPGAPGQEVVRDNRWVVPYNPYLLQKYRAHINVEVCATVQAIKYIHKYIYKGSDRTTVAVSNTDDEITRYLQGRYIGPVEACWRLFEFPTHHEFPPVQHLALHLEGQQTVYFADDLTAEELAVRAANTRSTLMAFFQYNTAHADGRQHLYQEFPQHYTWKASTGTWSPRKRGFSIGRMYHCSPVSGERYYLRLLLTVVRGPQSFADLYEVDGIRYPTYQAACIARGLAENDQEWYACFAEAALFTSGSGLRTLFLTGLRQRLIADPLEVWNRFKVHFCDDLSHQLSRMLATFPLVLVEPHYDYGLFLLSLGLTDLQQDLTDVGLPGYIFDWSHAHVQAGRTEDRALNMTRAASMQAQLNPDQLNCFQQIVTAITDDPQTAHFYLQGPGGTGKTFLYKALCYHLRSQGKTVLCVASTGIAALLLPDGRTSHSQFKIPIVLNESSVSTIAKNGKVATLLRQVDLVIWDEVPMQHKYCFEVVHRLFVDLRSATDDMLFGGVPVVLGGDFAQILPVVVGGSRADIVTACLQRSFIWPRLRRLHLRTNMRVRSGPQAEDFVRWIESLPYDPTLNGQVTLPNYISQPQTIQALIDTVYPPPLLAQATRDTAAFRGRTILTTLNRTVTELNTLILSRFPGALRTYDSIDAVEADGGSSEVHDFPAEYLQSIDLPSLPPSRLHLRVGVPVMLLRNLCPQEGLCNGSRIVVTSLRTHCLEGRLGGEFHGQLRTIPRIKLSSTDEQLPFTLARKQFPVRMCFAMTINKAQGQSFDIVGVDLRTPVFSHGQFYVAMSRVSDPAGLHVLLPETSLHATNIVWPEILQGLNYRRLIMVYRSYR